MRYYLLKLDENGCENWIRIRCDYLCEGDIYKLVYKEVNSYYIYIGLFNKMIDYDYVIRHINALNRDRKINEILND